MQADMVKLNGQKFHAFLGGIFRAVFLVQLIAATAFSQPLEYGSRPAVRRPGIYVGRTCRRGEKVVQSR